MNIPYENIKPHFDGKAGLIAGLAQQIGVDRIFNEALEKHTGRPTEVPYGTAAQMLLINIADEHHPLSRLEEYFERVDTETLFGHSVDHTKLTEDRFGSLLDAMAEFGPNELLSNVSVAAFKRYGIKLSNVNFDTTSKVMWGEYKAEEGKLESFEITFGYSKQKRFDKKQMMLSLGTTQGICIDGQILSGNTNDKRYNVDNLDRAKALRDKYETDSDDFFYIADSAAFTLEFLEKARSMSIHAITRMTDNVIEAKDAIRRVVDSLETLPVVSIETAKEPTKYRIMDATCDYHGIPLKMACCYSTNLEPQKRQTIVKKAAKEQAEISGALSRLEKREFACLEDATIEVKKFEQTIASKLKYHGAELSIQAHGKKRVGRPSKKVDPEAEKVVYQIQFVLSENAEAIEDQIKRECVFIVVSTKLEMTSEEILREYKTQSAVERNFQFLKSPQFISSFYLNSPKRIEALGYLLLILMVILSVAEHVVRRELAKEKEIIIGPGKVKMARPSLIAIYRIFYSVTTVSILLSGQRQRGFTKPLAPNVKKVLECLEIPESIYIRGGIF